MSSVSGGRSGSHASSRPRRSGPRRSIDVFVTTCGEPLEILEPTVSAAVALRGEHETYLLDDAARPEVAELADRYGATYVTRSGRKGAKAGNLNHALTRTSGELVCMFDADHVPQPDFLERIVGYFEDEDVAFVQTPQFYVNAHRDRVARGAYQQQALFYGPICRGKNGLNSAFCCGTNVVFRRDALEDVGGFDEKSVVEDFTTSIRIHRQGWQSIYYPYVLAEGLGPSDLRSYFRQQFRWARGSVGALATLEPFRRGLSLAQRVQYLLATTFYLTGVFTPVYVLLPSSISSAAGARSPPAAGSSSSSTSPTSCSDSSPSESGSAAGYASSTCATRSAPSRSTASRRLRRSCTFRLASASPAARPTAASHRCRS